MLSLISSQFDPERTSAGLHIQTNRDGY